MSFVYITEEGAYIQKRGGNFVVGRNRECVMEIPEEVLEGLTLIDSVQVSSKAMVELLLLGVRVQKSAFEAFLDEKKYERLVEETSRLIDVETDSLRIYLLANHTSVRSWGVGDRHVEDVIIF